MSDAPSSLEPAVIALRKEREALIERIRENEKLAAANPDGYRRKLRLLVTTAYGYVALLLLFALGLLGGVVWMFLHGWTGGGLVKLGLIALVMLFGILRSLWVKIEKPDGLLLPREQAPKLWAEVESIADRLNAPRPDEIRLNEEFNASATQWPRFGIFGGYRSILTLGLPLLASLDPEEARGVIAHEFGHFSGKHGRFGVWIYRIHATLTGLIRGKSGSASGPFWKWFEPRFAATSFALRRQHEYEADRAAAEIVGAPVVGSTLARLDALGEHQDRTFWTPFRSGVERQGLPAHGYFLRMTEAVRKPLDPASADRQLSFALAQPTGFDDSHPALKDRLRSLGVPPPESIRVNVETSAAEAYFGDALPRVAEALETDYAQRMAPLWTQLTARREGMTKALADLDAKARTAPPSEDDLIERAFLRVQLSDPAETIPLYRELLQTLPENGHAAFLLGDALLDADDEEGLPLLRRAAEREPKVAGEARASLARYHARHGDHTEYARLREEADEARDRETVAEGSSALTLKDDVLPPDLSPEERARLATSLATLKKLGAAYVVRKRLPGTGELRDYLFLAHRGVLKNDNPGALFLKQLDAGLDLVRPFTLVVDPNPKPWRKKLGAIPGALVYDAKA